MKIKYRLKQDRQTCSTSVILELVLTKFKGKNKILIIGPNTRHLGEIRFKLRELAKQSKKKFGEGYDRLFYNNAEIRFSTADGVHRLRGTHFNYTLLFDRNLLQGIDYYDLGSITENLFVEDYLGK